MIDYKDPRAVSEVYKKTTLEPWKVEKMTSKKARRANASDHVEYYKITANGNNVACYLTKEDAAFIAFSREALPYWQAETERLRAENAQLIKAHQEIKYLTNNRREEVRRLMNSPAAYNSEQADYIVSKGIADWEQVFKDALTGLEG